MDFIAISSSFCEKIGKYPFSNKKTNKTIEKIADIQSVKLKPLNYLASANKNLYLLNIERFFEIFNIKSESKRIICIFS
jgi:hypothetical protein